MMPKLKRHGADMLWKVGACQEIEGDIIERWNEGDTGRRIKTDIFTYEHAHASHTTVLLHKDCTTFYIQTLYTQTLLHTETLLHIKPFWTQRLFDTQAPLHINRFIRTFTHNPLLHTNTFTHRRFYTQTLSHTNTFTHKHSHTQTLLHTDPLTHTHNPPFTHTQTRLHTNHVANNYIQSLLHTNAFTHQRFCTQTLCTETLYTQTLWHTNALTHKRFYTKTLLHTNGSIHTNTFTHKRFYTQGGSVTTGPTKVAKNNQFLTLEPHFVRKGCYRSCKIAKKTIRFWHYVQVSKADVFFAILQLR